MTFRTVWGDPFPNWDDHATEAAAHTHAAQLVADGVERVTVYEIEAAGPEGER